MHMLSKKYYSEGVILKIDGKKLDPNLFNIGIEILHKLMNKVKNGKKISRNEYFKESDEIVYLGNIQPDAITIYNE